MHRVGVAGQQRVPAGDGLPEMQQAIGAAISFVLLLIVMRWG